jgi:hypothetical protein
VSLISAADTATWLIVAFTGLTAVVATVSAMVAAVAYRHNRALSGTSGAVIVRPGRHTVPWSEVEVAELPPGWNSEDTRWVPIRFVNRSASDVSVFPPENARLGWLRRRVEVGGGVVLVPTNDPQTTALLIRKRTRWGTRVTYWLVAAWEVGNGERARLRGRIHVKEIPAP